MEAAVPPTVLPRPDHPISRKLIDKDALWILNRLRREGYLAYLVGGAVRDLLLGVEPKDFDIGTDARPSEIKRLFRNCRLIGRRFRLAHVYFTRKGHPQKIVEVSTFRGRQPWHDPEEIPPEDLDLTGTTFGTPEEDAWRRDFTVNGLFYNLSDFSVIDYVGGLSDLEKGLIRIIGDPEIRFQEDPVRMLRAVEFAARLGFRIEEATQQGIVRCSPSIVEASPARIREELRQLQNRGIAAEVLAGAHRFGLMEHLLPEVEVMEGVCPLLEIFDRRARSGSPAGESSYVAALLLPTIANGYPLRAGVDLEDSQTAIAPPVDSLTHRYQISAHIRHLAKELLLSCYRIARGKAYRTKAKFVRKPEFADAWTFVRVWGEISGELDDVIRYWEGYLAGQGRGGQGTSRRRRRRRPRRPRPGGTNS